MDIDGLQQLFYRFFSGFGVPCFVEGSVPPGAPLPYLTFSWGVSGACREFVHYIRVYTRSGTFSELNGIIRRIAEAVPDEGLVLSRSALLYRGTPFFTGYDLSSGFSSDSGLKAGTAQIVSRLYTK